MKSVIITGASSGIGREIALTLDASGWSCGLLGRNKERLKQTQSELKNPSVVWPLDLTEIENLTDSVAQFAKENSDFLNSLSCVVNNAGIFERKYFLDSEPEDWKKNWLINLAGPVEFTKQLLPFLSEGSNILNISSSTALKPVPMTTHYSATKAAMNSWTQNLALELGKKRIRVNAICPGIIDTPIHDFHTDENKEDFHQLQPLGRLGTPKEVAQATDFLCSEKASWITGALLTVDGGISIL